MDAISIARLISVALIAARKLEESRQTLDPELQALVQSKNEMHAALEVLTQPLTQPLRPQP